jgi:hypothetical protein
MQLHILIYLLLIQCLNGVVVLKISTTRLLFILQQEFQDGFLQRFKLLFETLVVYFEVYHS